MPLKILSALLCLFIVIPSVSSAGAKKMKAKRVTASAKTRKPASHPSASMIRASKYLKQEQ